MAGPNNAVVSADGSMDFSGGVNSLKTTTIQNADQNPNGLPRNMLSWLINATLRDGGITARTGWQYLGTIADGSAVYQGGYMYEPDTGNPYLVLSIGGNIIIIYPDSTIWAPLNISATTGLSNAHMPNIEQAYFCQGEQFLVIQNGDYFAPGAAVAGVTEPVTNRTLPLFWDGHTLWRSRGITNYAVAAGTPGVNEIPPGTCMDYYMGRLWYAAGKKFFAGDIVGGKAGTFGHQWRDAILNVTENPLVLNTAGGDGFAVPDNAGNIRVLTHNAQLNSTLGQGQLLIGTRKAIYAMDVPVTRDDWTSADTDKAPKQTVVQLVNGPVNDRATVRVNGDIFYWTLDPQIASLAAAVRYFDQWGNKAISNNEQRAMDYTDRALMHGLSGICFDNRLLMTALPIQTSVGIAGQAIIPMDFVPMSDFGASNTPIWQGIYEGLYILQLFVGDFGGRERAFAVTVSKIDGTIQLWELTDYLKTDIDTTGERRTDWIVEFPAFTWGDSFMLKNLAAGELWFDKVYGEVIFNLQYRVDQDPCWYDWHLWKVCSARSSCEDVHNPVCYPDQTYRETFKATQMIPKPIPRCEAISGRPTTIGFQFQPKLTIKGWCRIRGILLYANPVERALGYGLSC